MTTGSPIVIINNLLSVPLALVAVIVKLYTPATVGVPDRTLFTNVIPFGNEDIVDHVIGVFPLAAKFSEYAVPLMAVKFAPVVITGAPDGPIVIVNCLMCA